MGTFTENVPKSLYLAKNILGMNIMSCPKCSTLYSVEHCKVHLPDKTVVTNLLNIHIQLKDYHVE